MAVTKKMISILFVYIFLTSCATDRSAEKKPETGPDRVIVQVEPSERVDALMEKMKSLEQSVSTLRAEVATLRYHINLIQVRPSLATYKLPVETSLCGERIPVEDRQIWENLDREFLLALGSEVQVLLWMKRARRYFPYIEKRLRDLGLPDDLKYVTITESGLRPKAVSISGASGIWQFIPATGERYGMNRNRGIDERFDFFKATEGALAYLKSLYDEFRSWTLAMAAYNAGENRVRKEIELQKTRDYFYLDLPMETERYVYKIAVAKIILSHPKKYGFHLEEKELYDPLQVERVQIELTQPLPIAEVARAIGFFYKEVRELNPQFSEEAIPPGIRFINLPLGTSEKFRAFFSNWDKERKGK